MRKLIALWNILKRPPVHISLGIIIIASFFAGVIFWGGFNTAMEYTNSEQFCISCHEMENNVYQELQTTVHWQNRSGVRAICSDCHVPHDWTNKMARKMQASKEVWGKIFGTINTREKFEAKRLEMAQREWDRFKANGSLECRNCHDYNSMEWSLMSDAARRAMVPAAERNQSCMDCHKGIAHHLPTQMGSEDPLLAAFAQEANATRLASGHSYFTAKPVELFTDPQLTQPAGTLAMATGVTVTAVENDSVQLEIAAWRKEKGFGRVLYEDFGRNIISAVLEKDMALQDSAFTYHEKKEDDLTGLPWAEISVKLWAQPGAYIPHPDPMWESAEQTYRDACSVCHAEPDPEHFSANGWPAMFAGMVGFTNLGQNTQDLVLKYLQKHSSDYVQGSH